jgi:hypothetical protein
MSKILQDIESEIWDIPSIGKKDNSIVKQDVIKVYEDHHGSSNLLDATSFSFTTDNEELWLLPSESYLKINCYLRKPDKNAFNFIEIAAVGADAAADPPVVAAPLVPAQDINVCDNGFNLFEEARYYINNDEVERIDYLGMNTLVQQLFNVNTDAKQNAVRHSELLFFEDHEDRQEYVKESHGHLHLLLPINKIFRFIKENNHVFRGVKHRITLSLNDAGRLIRKAANVPEGKIFINEMTWVIPYYEPSLDIMSRLESQFAKSSEFTLTWPNLSVFKYQPMKLREVRLPLACTIHKPTKIFVALQKLIRNTQEHQSMVLDHLDMEEAYVEINSEKFPDKPLSFNFADKDYMELYQNFLDNCENKETLVDYLTFRNKYPILCIDVSKHKPELFENSTFPNLVLNLKFKNVPTQDYICWLIIENEREATLNIENRKMHVVR